MVTFDLLKEPWIPARDKDTGQVRAYGLLDLLLNAHRLTEVVDPAPPIQFGLYRLLSAFLMAALPVRSLTDLRKWLKAGALEPEPLLAYVERVGRQRFDLFDPAHPFLQSGPAADDAKNEGPVTDLFFHLPSGTNVTHFHHGPADQHAVSPAVCARALTAIAPFMTQGGAGYSPSINGTPPWYVLVRCPDNLLTTLLWNTYALENPLSDGVEPPAWASIVPVGPKQEAVPESVLAGMTWCPRRVRLLPGEGGVCTYSGKEVPVLVRRMVYGPGFKFAGGESWLDPNTAYQIGEKRLPLRPEEARELWRDVGPLLLLRRDTYTSANGKVSFERPQVVEQFLRLKEYRAVKRDEQLLVEIYGMRAEQAKVFEWVHDRLALPVAVAENPRAGAQVQAALELADSVAYYLGRSIKCAYPRQGASNKKALQRLIENAQRQFWADLKVEFDRSFLSTLAQQAVDDLQAPEQLRSEWQAHLKRIGKHVLDDAIGPLDTGAGALERQVEAREAFRRALFNLMEPAANGANSRKKRRTGA